MPRWRGKVCSRFAYSHHGFGEVVDFGHRGRVPPVDLFAPRVLLAGGVAEGLRDVADGGAGPVGDDVGDLRGVVPPVLLVDVLDGFLAAVGLDVHVDVRRPVPLRGQEPFEQQPPPHRVDVGDAQGVADRGVRRRSAALAVDVLPAAEVHDVVHDQEVAGEVQRLDGVQLVVELPVGVRVLRPGAVPLQGALHGEVPQPTHLGVALADVAGGQPGGDQLQVERQLPTQPGRVLHRAGVAGEPGGHLVPGPQVRRRAGRQPPVQLVHRPAGPHRRHHGGQPVPAGSGVVHVAGRHRRQPVPGGQLGQGVVAFVVLRVPVVGQLDRDAVAAEQRHQAVQLPAGRRHPALGQRGADVAFAAPGQHHHLPAQRRRHLLQVVHRPALLTPGQLGQGDRAGQRGIPLPVPAPGPAGAGPAGSGSPFCGPGSPSDSSAPNTVGRPSSRAASANRTTPYSPSWSVTANPDSPNRYASSTNSSGMGRAVQEAEVGVAVQLHVLHRRACPAPAPAPGTPRGAGSTPASPHHPRPRAGRPPAPAPPAARRAPPPTATTERPDC